MNKNLEKTKKKIENLTQAIAEIGYNSELKKQLILLEDEKQTIIKEISNYNTVISPNITKEKTISAYKKIKELFETNDIDINKKLINIFLNKVMVYEDRVEIFINSVPFFNNENYILELNTSSLLENKQNNTTKNAHNNKLMCTKNFGSTPKLQTEQIKYFGQWFAVKMGL